MPIFTSGPDGQENLTLSLLERTLRAAREAGLHVYETVVKPRSTTCQSMIM
jgi:hypothetical protein